MINSKNPKIVEDNVLYFLRETLKQCSDNKKKTTTMYYNLGFLLFFIGIILSIMMYKYKNKMTEEQKEEKMYLKGNYLLNKVKSMSKSNRSQYYDAITELPKFTSEFEKLHKNFFNV